MLQLPISTLFISLLVFIKNITAVPVPSDSINVNPRSSQTCADPSLSDVILDGFSPSAKAHALLFRWIFEDSATRKGSDFQIQGEIFRAFKSQQESTQPFFRMFNPTTSDFMYLLPNPDGTNPTADGFQLQDPIGFVYPTQICGSVPLFVLFEDVIGDHWYTTIASEKDAFVESGWIDSGIAAYVLGI